MQTIFLDFETYYDENYSLRKLTPVEYILDPRFEILGCAVKCEFSGKAYWLDGPQLPEFFCELDADDTLMVTHNALFDMCIVAWIYGFRPRLMVDTMSVARASLGHVLKSVSLNMVSRHLKLGGKTGALAKVKGMNLEMIKAAGLYEDFVDYGLNDVDLCAGIYDRLVRTGIFPVTALITMDMVIRAATEPVFTLSRDVLATHLNEVLANKDRLLQTAGIADRSDLMSNDKFANLLRAQGVEPPTKISPRTGKETYAFAKTDPGMIALEDHSNITVQALVAARVGHKSTLEETRCKRLISISNLTWPGNGSDRGHCAAMPVPLRFSGAHTHRLSGDWKLNLQNLPRGGNLRRALTAPPGHTVMSIDKSQIEARLVAWICGQWDLVEAFAEGEDVYSMFAGDVFDMPVNKTDNPDERFVGKQGILGLGYGLGHATFRVRLKSDSRLQIGAEIDLSVEDSQRVVNTYRSKYHRIPAGWRTLNYTAIPTLAHGGSFQFGPCEFRKGEVVLPDGLNLHYHDLALKDDEWWFTHAGKPKYLYGGKMLENICQKLAGMLIMAAAVRILKRTGRRFALQVHDELVYVVPNNLVEAMQVVLLEEFTRRPVWGPELPLAAEVGIGLNYADAK